MAPESDARERAIYDHENVEPRRPRRAAADWGVNEDIFDRMPSRFGRVERRGQHQEIVLRRSALVVIERPFLGFMFRGHRLVLVLGLRG